MNCPHFKGWTRNSIEEWSTRTRHASPDERQLQLKSFVAAWKSSQKETRPWTQEQETCGWLLSTMLLTHFSNKDLAMDSDNPKALWAVSRQLLTVNQPTLYQVLLEHPDALRFTNTLRKSGHLGLEDTTVICNIAKMILYSCKKTDRALEENPEGTHIKIVTARPGMTKPKVRTFDEVWSALTCTASPAWQAHYKPWWTAYASLRDGQYPTPLKPEHLAHMLDAFVDSLDTETLHLESIDNVVWDAP